MYIKYFKTEDEKWGRKIMAGRKSKYSSENSNTNKSKIWSVAIYIRLSQEDVDMRRREE